MRTKAPGALPPHPAGPGPGSRLATLGGLGAILLWSTTVALARSLAEALGPTTAAAAVYSVGAVAALVPLLGDRRRRQRIRRLPARYVAGCGALFLGYTLLLFLAVGRADGRQQVLEVGLVNYLWPALTLLLSLPLLGNRARRGLLPGTLLALAGVFLVVTHLGPLSWSAFHRHLAGNPAAYGLALAGAAAWAVYSNLTRRWAGGREAGAVAVFLPLTAGALLLVCACVDEPRAWSARSAAEAAFLGLATWAAYTLWDTALRRGNLVTVVAASYLTPLLSTLAGCLYLAVVPGPRLWVGCGLLVVGSILSWRSVSGAPARTLPLPVPRGGPS